jgi:hypothetical protein
MRRPALIYVTLFSNASYAVYPDNTRGAFTMELTSFELYPNENWVVGLCEFSGSQPSTGTFKNFEVVGDKNAITYCELISP